MDPRIRLALIGAAFAVPIVGLAFSVRPTSSHVQAQSSSGQRPDTSQPSLLLAGERPPGTAVQRPDSRKPPSDALAPVPESPQPTIALQPPHDSPALASTVAPVARHGSTDRPIDNWKPSRPTPSQVLLDAPTLRSGSRTHVLVACFPSASCTVSDHLLTVGAESQSVVISWSSSPRPGFLPWNYHLRLR